MTLRVPGAAFPARGFTLIEILVSVSVMAILLGALLPALSRLGRFHGGGEGDAFHAAMYDGSARLRRKIPEDWQQPLPR